MTRSHSAAFGAAVVLLLALTGCAAPAPGSGTAAGSTPGSAAGSAPAPGSSELRLPPSGAVPDYQLGGAYEPDRTVTLVARDRSADPDPTRYSICYVNGFQTQPGQLELWPEDALLRTADGDAMIDPAWPDEVLLDTGTDAQREQILAMVQPWIAGCAAAGFDAVEFDNLDSYTRSDETLSLADNLALATELVAAAHKVGLAAGQKNAAEDAQVLRDRAGFDFAVTEECAAYRECELFSAVYGGRVIDIEYADELPRPFAEMCSDPESPDAMILRDRDLTTPADPAHVFERCA